MNILWTALALVLVIEGLLYALFPNSIRQAMAVALRLPTDTLRLGGLTVATLGVASLWLLRH